jgi:hypothetical protein
MKLKFINNLIKQHLLPAFPGFGGPHAASLLIVPMNHIWRGFSFESSADPDWFYLYVNVLPLYMPITFKYVGLGHRLRHGRIERWHWNEARAPELIAELIQTLKVAEQDHLEKLRTPLEIGRAGPPLLVRRAPNDLEIAAFSLIYAGEFKEALPLLEELCDGVERRLSRARKPGEEKEEYQLRKEKVRDLLRADPEAARAQLLEWEQRSIKVLKLEKYTN